MKWVIFRATISTLLVTLLLQVQAQDLFDYKNSKSFADYLYQTKRYELSTREYQRILFLKPSDTSSWVNLVRSYQFQQDFDKSLAFLDSAETTIGQGDKRFGKLRAYAYLKKENFDVLKSSLSRYPYDEQEETILLSSNNALAGNWSYFQSLPETNNYWLKNFKSMADEISQQKRKSPFVAGALSSIIPGSGKIYSKRGKDGLFSFILVGSTAWQAARLISRKGISHVGSLFFTGFAVGLYTGNIYGSVKAAKEFNETVQIRNHERSSDLVDLYFGY